ncbi:uncharacterized protein LOC111947866 isoform X2 [Oryzias latipes]
MHVHFSVEYPIKQDILRTNFYFDNISTSERSVIRAPPPHSPGNPRMNPQEGARLKNSWTAGRPQHHGEGLFCIEDGGGNVTWSPQRRVSYLETTCTNSSWTDFLLTLRWRGCQVHLFQGPACSPSMLAVAVDGTCKMYCFESQLGLSGYFEDAFLTKNTVETSFVNCIHGAIEHNPGDGRCGAGKFVAAPESSNKSSGKVNEEGSQSAIVEFC